MSLDYMLSVPEEQFDLQEAYWPFTAMGEIDDECYLPKGETCIALSAALGRLAETRDDVFAFEDTNTRLPAVCGLKVKGDACIPIPLTEKYAKLLLDKCTKSDVGEKRSGNGVVGTPWEVTGNSESSVWFSINGEKLRDWDFEHGGDPLQWSAHLNFLNPGTLSPREMWSDHMSRDGLVDEQTIEYTAHAIVGWPLARDLENTSTLIGEGAAIKGILAENPVKFLKLRTLMEIAVGNENDKEHRCSWDNSVSPYMNFCQDMCSAIAAAGDVSLVGKFFTKFFGRLKNKQQLAPTILIMMNQFGWDAIAAHLTGAMNQQNQHDALVFAVKLADDCRAEAKFESPATMLAIEKARGVPGEVLSSFDHLGLLWKCASTCPSPAAFTAIETLLKNLDGGLLAPVLTCISSCVDQASPTNQRSALTALVSSRCQWLAAARKFVSDNNRTPNGPNRTASYTMSAQGSGKNAAVVVTKTREYFESLKKKLDAMSDELARLSKDYPLSTSSMNSTIGIKRPRDE
ncbi:hypothetical protein PR002_g14488 [Phytophthora rubi]|uniref:Uncharacterized protein n=1 Tax=Phytophthora rubi TaxID=129364 RepID=A0A6A3L397_9STRA|nr:hypothetical protein PR002_g14488 [Phytophthora rubi]